MRSAPSPSPKKERANSTLQPPSDPIAKCSIESSSSSPSASWLADDDPSLLAELDHLARAIAATRAKPAPRNPSLLADLLSHFAASWLPELAADHPTASARRGAHHHHHHQQGQSPTAAWLRKRFLVESLAGLLPPEKGAVPCDFLLRLLRAAGAAGAGAECVAELEARAARQLEEATLKELMIPASGHACGTLLDVGLVLRLVQRFVGGEEVKSGAAMAKVARLVDAYLAEAALDAGLAATEFEELACAVPAYARAADDGLYRAIDTFIKAHPNTAKQERKILCSLIDARKLSAEASLHAAQNERLPVRSVIQVLLCEQSKLGRLVEWSGSFSGPRSPNLALDPVGRCHSKREVSSVQQQEMRRLRDDVARLQVQCHALQAQIDRLNSEKKKKKGFFKCSFMFRSSDVAEKVEDYKVGAERRTPMASKKGRMVEGVATPPKWRNSLS